jgi:SAM-dependent methyltransferase
MSPLSASEPVSTAVERFYNTYPFPPEPLLDEPPPGYNWRWYYPAAYAFCTGQTPAQRTVRILDAGCGTGVSTEYLGHLNPEASVLGIDLSPGALAVAEERCQRSGAGNVHFQQLSIYDCDQILGQFDQINCVGVLHHMADPVRGLRALADKLAAGGILHIFVYGELGRWEISLMQRAIALLQGPERGDYSDGVAIGRALFAHLPETNRLLRRERERWSMENHHDASFADMYVHPQEIDYNIETLFDLIDSSGLDFLGFSNPQVWSLARLMGDSDLLWERAAQLGDRQRYRLVELLDPEISHYEFFLGRPPLPRCTWQHDDDLLAAQVARNPCMHGWPSPSIFNQDYQPLSLTETAQALLQAADTAHGQASVAELVEISGSSLTEIRQLQRDALILLSPAGVPAA